MIRLLVLDAYDRSGRAALRGAGGTEAGVLYSKLLARIAPEASIDVFHPADPDAELPVGAGLADYDGVVWTGSNLSLRADDLAVRRQVELARQAYAAGVPSFGSCYAAQLAVVAAGGGCREHPLGREFGVAREITLTDAGRAHPLFEGKPAVFAAWTSHADEIATLPPGATILAANRWSRVQAVAVKSGRGEFWALQYHPEYDAHEVAGLCALRSEELVAQGTFADAAEAAAWRRDLVGARLADVDAALLDPATGELEVSNWLERLVIPSAGR